MIICDFIKTDYEIMTGMGAVNVNTSVPMLLVKQRWSQAKCVKKSLEWFSLVYLMCYRLDSPLKMVIIHNWHIHTNSLYNCFTSEMKPKYLVCEMFCVKANLSNNLNWSLSVVLWNHLPFDFKKSPAFLTIFKLHWSFGFQWLQSVNIFCLTLTTVGVQFR